MRAPHRPGPGTATNQALPDPKIPPNRVLTDGKNGLECAAPFDETPPGGKLKGESKTSSRGVDESKNRAIMGGSLRQNANGYGSEALRPVSNDL